MILVSSAILHALRMQVWSEGLTVQYAVSILQRRLDGTVCHFRAKVKGRASAMIQFVSSSTRGISSEGKISRVS